MNEKRKKATEKNQEENEENEIECKKLIVPENEERFPFSIVPFPQFYFNEFFQQRMQLMEIKWVHYID